MELTKVEYIRFQCLKMAAAQVKGKVETLQRAELYEAYIEGDEALVDEVLHDQLKSGY